MKPDVEARLNGVSVVFRFITPCMIGILMAMTSSLLSDIREMRFSLSNHLNTDVKEISERLARIEQQLGIPPR